MDIKKGNIYMCIEDVQIGDYGKAFTKNKVYSSNADGSLIDDNGIPQIDWLLPLSHFMPCDKIESEEQHNDSSDVRSYNVGNSDYAKHKIQPWDIWLEYGLNPWDADIVKRILRTKVEADKTAEESRILDYQKIIHICNERIRQLKIK